MYLFIYLNTGYRSIAFPRHMTIPTYLWWADISPQAVLGIICWIQTALKQRFGSLSQIHLFVVYFTFPSTFYESCSSQVLSLFTWCLFDVSSPPKVKLSQLNLPPKPRRPTAAATAKPRATQVSCCQVSACLHTFLIRNYHYCLTFIRSI